MTTTTLSYFKRINETLNDRVAQQLPYVARSAESPAGVGIPTHVRNQAVDFADAFDVLAEIAGGV
jgi:hypothetical protein